MAGESDTERLRIILELEAERAEKQAKSLERQIGALERRFDPLAKATQRYERDQRTLSKALEAGKIDADRYQKALDKVEAEYQDAQAAAARATKAVDANSAANGRAAQAANVHAAAQGRMSGFMNRNRSMFQQAGYQVGDFAVQVQGGTSAVTAFTQQGSQMLGVFGAFGAITGAALAVGVPLAASFFNSAESAVDAGDSVDALNKALDDFERYAKIADASLVDLRKDFGVFAEEVRDVAGYMAKVSVSRAVDAANAAMAPLMAGIKPALDALDELDRATKEFERQREMGVATSQQLQVFEEAMETARDAAYEASKAIGVMPDDVRAISLAIKEFGAAETMEEIARAAANVVAEIERMYPEGVKVPPLLAEMGTHMETILAASGRAVDAAAELADEYERGEGALKRMSDEARKMEARQGYQQSRTSGAWLSRSNGMDAATDLIRDKEGYRSGTYWDVNAHRIGYGSDTHTGADGSVGRVQAGDTTTIEAAERDLRRRISAYFDAIIAQVGQDRFDALTGGQKGALASLMHNYGAGEFRAGGDLGGVVAAIQSGRMNVAADEIARLGAHNGGINRNRRIEEASAFGGASDPVVAGLPTPRGPSVRPRSRSEGEADHNEEVWTAEQAAIEQAEEARKRYIERLQESAEAQDFERSIMGLSAAEQAEARTRFLLLNEAKEQGIALDEQMAETGMTVRESIEAQAQAAGALVEVKERQIEANKRLAESEKEAADRADFYEQVQQRLKDGIVDAIVEGENFADVLGNVARMLAKAALQAALFGEGPMAGGGGGGLFGTIASAIFGGVGGGSAGAGAVAGARANGGPVSSGESYLVGERGVERFVPNVPGTIVPNHKMGGGAQKLDVGVSIDGAGNLLAIIRDEAGRVVASQRQSIVGEALGKTPGYMNEHRMRFGGG